MKTRLTRNQKVAIVFTLLILLADILTPLGVAVGVLYVFPILLINASRQIFIAIYSTIVCIFITLKFFIYSDISTTWMALENQILSIALVVIAAFFSMTFSNYFWLRFIEKDTHSVKERYFTNIIENLIEGAQLISFDWKFLYVNIALTKQTGLNKSQLIGFKIYEVYPDIEYSELFKKLSQCMLRRESAIFINEFQFPDGRVEVFELNIHPVNEGLFILSMVITDKIRMEKERMMYTKNLEEMLFITSHKIRQPVTNIIGLAELLEYDSNLSNDASKALFFIKESAIKLDSFTHELNNFIVEKAKK